eukprot:976924-Heterocapsa_arctica.AAC.1
MLAFQAEWPETKPGTCDDVAEICGGAPRISVRCTQWIIRKSYRGGKKGKNVDILVAIDLRDRQEVARRG